MEDSRIIQLFFQRDEEAIEEVSRSILPIALKLSGTSFIIKKTAMNVSMMSGLHSGHIFHRTDQNVCLHLQEK